jgi:hypothetical protein
MLDKDQYVCLIEYAGKPAAASWSRWSIFMDGFIAPQKYPLDSTRFYNVPANLPRDTWHIEIIGIKKPAETSGNSGP